MYPCAGLPVEWTLPELLDAAGAGPEARSAFASGPVMLFHGGWQSWSPGWELAPGETLPRKVRLFPALYTLTAAPWELSRSVSTERENRGWISGSFIMYLRSGDWYLALAAESAETPVVYTVRADRQIIRAGLYGGKPNSGGVLRVFCAKGIFSLKDTLAQIYSQDRNFRELDFLGERPGGYMSWYSHYTRISEKIILHDLESLVKHENLVKLYYLDRGKPAIFQIDDGWQKAVGDWDSNSARFPGGLRAIAGKIEEAGMIPGLWLAPFLVTKKAGIFRDKPQWLLKNKNGVPVRAGWNPNWDGVYYCLDLSRDDVLEYLGGLAGKIIEEWGFRFIKFDFLYAGFLGGPEKAPPAYENACRVLTAKKSGTGRKAACLGCGLPLGASFRRFPLSRIGVDTRESWDWTAAKFLGHLGRPSAFLNLRDTIGRSFMNGTVYKNDPDVLFLRSKNCRLAVNEKELIALVNFLLAGQIMLSDVSDMSESDRALTRRIVSLYEKLEGDEYGAVMIEKDVYRLESRSGRVEGIINLSASARRGKTRRIAPRSIALWYVETGLPVLDDAESYRIGL